MSIKSKSGKNGIKGKPGRKSDPFVHGLTPEMISDPRPLSFAEGMDSYEFACEKVRRLIIEPGGFSSLRSLQDFIKSCWDWTENAPERETKDYIHRVILDLQHKISEVGDNAKLREDYKKEVEQLLATI